MAESKSGMVLYNVHVPKRYLDMLDKLVERKIFPNRAEAVRAAIRDLINYHARRKPPVKESSPFTVTYYENGVEKTVPAKMLNGAMHMARSRSKCGYAFVEDREGKLIAEFSNRRKISELKRYRKYFCDCKNNK